MGDDDTSTVVPRLRFPEFREAGEWCERPLGDFLDYQQPAPFLVSSTEYDPAFKTPVLTAGKTFILGYTNEESGIFDAGLPVIIFDDFTTATQFVTFPFKAKSSAMKILTAKDGADIKFMFELLQAIPYEVGAHERHWISTFAPMLVATPQPAEQQKIADCLTSLDEVIAAQGPKVEALKAHKKGLMQQLFPREGETLPRLRFPEFRDSGDWHYVTVKEVAMVTTGDKDTQNKVGDGEYPFFVRSQSTERINSYAYDGEAVLTSGDGVGVGNNYHYIIGKFDFHQRVYCIYGFHKRMNGKFFYLYFSEHFGKRVKALSAKNSVDSVRMPMIADMPIGLPPPAEQQRIADCLSSLDDQITAGVHKLAALKLHKKGLMQQLFPSPNDA
jgi:type I restriction enzyme S subunit